MVTKHQALGNFGESIVAKQIRCPNCEVGVRTLRRLPVNFKCADLICDFCGFLSQVKTSRVKNINEIPDQILGAAWKPQIERMEKNIYFALFLVLIDKEENSAIYYLPKEGQTKEMFIPRKPLSVSAKRSGWQGYLINLSAVKHSIIRIKDF